MVLQNKEKFELGNNVMWQKFFVYLQMLYNICIVLHCVFTS